MVRELLRGLIAIVGAGIGVGLTAVLDRFNFLERFAGDFNSVYIHIAGGIIVGLIFLLFSKRILSFVSRVSLEIEKHMQSIPTVDIVLGSIGLVVGFIIAFLLSEILMKIPFVGLPLSLLAYLALGYFGMKILTKKRDDFGGAFDRLKSPPEEKCENEKDSNSEVFETVNKAKVLDTSVIIDGRIFEICETGFLEGPLVIPEFVLKELQHIADSSDSLKRAKGRRGLDVLNKIQKELDIEVRVTDRDYSEPSEVDLKLLKLAQELKGKVVTNDYNLNKVAEVHGVEVLNINELSNAVKPIAIPGEEMKVQVIKVGKEQGQGIAYLDDGTMIVVESGRSYVGKTIDVIVTSVIQTPAGRMIFGKPKELFEKEGI